MLKCTILSIKAQTYTNWEAIIVDDHSDISLDHLKSFFSNDHRIRFFVRNGENGGAPVCRNEGLKHSKGDYLIFLDSDDLLAPFCLEQRISCFENNQEYEFLVFRTVLFGRKPGDLNYYTNLIKDELPLHRFIKQDNPWQITCPIWKRNSLLTIYPWDESLKSFQDFDFHIRALIYPLKYTMIDEANSFYRVNTGHESIANSYFNTEIIESRFLAFTKAYFNIKNRGILNNTIRRLLAAAFVRNILQLLDNDKSDLAYEFFIKNIPRKIFLIWEWILLKRMILFGKNWRYKRYFKVLNPMVFDKSFDNWGPNTYCKVPADPGLDIFKANYDYLDQES